MNDYAESIDPLLARDLRSKSSICLTLASRTSRTSRIMRALTLQSKSVTPHSAALADLASIMHMQHDLSCARVWHAHPCKAVALEIVLVVGDAAAIALTGHQQSSDHEQRLISWDDRKKVEKEPRSEVFSLDSMAIGDELLRLGVIVAAQPARICKQRNKRAKAACAQ
eukprot:COSAG02_NODE_6522_length_3522_cov_1.832603_3_plen_168_part_00